MPASSPRPGASALPAPCTTARSATGRRCDGQTTLFDLGAQAHGPDAAAAAGRMAGHMRAWLDAGSPSPVLQVLPLGTPDGSLPAGTVLDKRHSRVVLTFTPA